MKLVREHINEKFEEKSDPIEDMGIGAAAIYQDIKDKVNRMGYTSSTSIISTLIETDEYADEIKKKVIDYAIDKKKIDINDKYFGQMVFRNSNISDDMRDFLIDAGIRIKAKAFINELLIEYCKNNDTEKIIKLVKGGADPRMRGNKPIMLAIRHRNKKLWDLMEPYIKWK